MKRMWILLAATSTLLVSPSPPLAQDVYFKFDNLNLSSVTATSSWTKLETGTHSFTTEYAATIEAHMDSRFDVTSFLDSDGVLFQLRIDDTILPDYDTRGSLPSIGSLAEFLSMFAVFQDVPAGAHTVSVWARTYPAGSSATGVGVDPGGWDGAVILKVDGDSVVDAAPSAPATPARASVRQNYPNPFHPKTTIHYAVERPSRVELNIYNAAGQRIISLVDEYKSAGEHRVIWDGTNGSGQRVASGSYFYQVKSGDFVSTKKMILVK